MPPIRVRDRITGRVDTIDWNETRPPTRAEILSLLQKQEGTRPLTPGVDTNPNRGFRLQTPNAAPSSNSMFSKVVDTMWGGEHSVLPPIRGITRPALPEISPEYFMGIYGSNPLAGTNPVANKWVYDNVLRPSSSAVGLASDWATGKVVGPVVKPVAKYIGGKAASMFGRFMGPAIEEAAPAVRKAPLLLPERTATASRYAVDEAGVATDLTRPVTTLDRRPTFDPRSVRGPSGTVDPATGRVKPVRGPGGKFVARAPEPVPTVLERELPVIDLPPEISAAYPGTRPSSSPRLPPVSNPDAPPGYVQAQRRAAREVSDFNKRAPVHSPTDPAARSGPVSREYTGVTTARKVGETRAAYKARLAKESAVNRAAAAVEKAATESGKPRDAAAAKEIQGLLERLRTSLANDKGRLGRLGNEKGEIPIGEIWANLRNRKKGSVIPEVPKETNVLPPEFSTDVLKVDAPGPGGGTSPRFFDRLKDTFLDQSGSVPRTQPAITLAKPSIFSKMGRERIKGELVDAANVPRALMSAVDLSGFRQAMGVLHKKELRQAIPDMLRSLTSEEKFEALQGSIAAHPKIVRMRKAKLGLTDLKNAPGHREELFMSRMAEKIPGYGKLVRASGRAYVGLLNKTRADLFDNLTDLAAKTGAKTSDAEIARFINAATGRGNLPRTIERAAPVLNAAFFSPRLMSSRMTMLNPVTYVNADPFVRKEFLKSAAAIGGVWGGLTGLVKMASDDKVDVELDPRSSDFGKVRIGDTRIDFSGGFQQYIRVASQIAPEFMGGGQIKDLQTKKLHKLGQGYRGRTRLDVLETFVENKLAPLFSLGVTSLRGRTFSGEKPQMFPNVEKIKDFKSGADEVLGKSEITKRLTPMIAQDLWELWKEDPDLAPWGVAGALGAGINVQKRRAVKRRFQ